MARTRWACADSRYRWLAARSSLFCANAGGDSAAAAATSDGLHARLAKANVCPTTPAVPPTSTSSAPTAAPILYPRERSDIHTSTPTRASSRLAKPAATTTTTGTATPNGNPTRTSWRATTRIRFASASTSEHPAAAVPGARATAASPARYARPSFREHAAAIDAQREPICSHTAAGLSPAVPPATAIPAARRTRQYCASGAAVPTKHPDVA